MKKTTSHLKIPCIALNRILVLKKLEGKPLNDAYAKLKNFFRDSKGDNTILQYIKLLISLVVEDVESLKGILKTDNREEEEAVLSHLYNTIIEVYGPFDMRFVSGDYNGVLPTGDADDKDNDFIKMLENRPKPQPEDLKSDTATNAPTPKKAKKKVKVNKNIINFNSMEDIEALRSFLQARVIGQDEAIEVICNYMKLKVSRLTKRASMFFIGKTGVGKTHIAKLLGEKYSGNYFKVNCAEYSHGHEYQKLIGAPPGYIGHTEKSILAQKAEISNKWVFLFDEIEKGHEKLFNLLLNLLDEGTIADNNGKDLDFSESIFVFTSNKGLSDIKNNYLGFKDGGMSAKATKEELVKAIDKGFSPEFRNRIDEYIFFRDLQPEHIRDIIKLHLNEYPIKQTDTLLDYILKGAYNPLYGAREVARFIKRNVAGCVADALLSGLYPSDIKNLHQYECVVVDGKVQVINTTKINPKTKNATPKES